MILGQLLPRVYAELGELNVSRATAGGTDSIKDSTIADIYPNGTWTGGCLFLIRDAGGAGVAPENQFAIISDYKDNVSGEAIFEPTPAFSVAPAVGDTYGFASNKYPLYQSIQAANDALKNLGDFPGVDTTTLDTASSQTEYAASVAWKRRAPYRIDVQGRLGDADDNAWIETFDWEYVPAGPGTAGLIIFRTQAPASHAIRVWYQDAHATVALYSDFIDELIDPETMVLATAEKLLVWRTSQQGGSEAFLLQKLADVRTRLANRLIEHRMYKPKRTPKLMILNGISTGSNFTYP